MTSCTQSNETEMNKSVIFPEPPEKPLDSDCCGNGCDPCVFDLYDQEVAVWRAECKKLETGQSCLSANFLQCSTKVLTLQPDEYTEYTIEKITQESEDAIRVRCSLDHDQDLGLNIGQHIIIRCNKPDGVKITRQYTPISPVGVKGFFELIIKIYPDGQMSQLVKNWKAEDILEARGPIGQLKYTRNKFKRVLMLCAGTGIAPMCQVIHSVLADDLEDTVFRLVYGCRTYTQLIAKSELDEWQRYWNFSVLYVLSQEPDQPLHPYKYGEKIVQGHIDKSLITSELGDTINDTLVLVCGTPSFESDVLKILRNTGISEDHIHKF